MGRERTYGEVLDDKWDANYGKAGHSAEDEKKQVPDMRTPKQRLEDKIWEEQNKKGGRAE